MAEGLWQLQVSERQQDRGAARLLRKGLYGSAHVIRSLRARMSLSACHYLEDPEGHTVCEGEDWGKHDQHPLDLVIAHAPRA